MHIIRKLTSVFPRLFLPSQVKRITSSSKTFTLKSVMEASKNNIAFFANAEDATDHFHSMFCSNVSQGVGIKNFIKNYPDAVYTTARISGDELMVLLIIYVYLDLLLIIIHFKQK